MQLGLRYYAATLALLFFVVACADAPTTTEPAGAVKAVPFRSSVVNGPPRAEGLTPVPCTFAIRTDHEGFRSRQAQVNFPAAELHPYGARRAYLYRRYAGAELVLVAHCAIPATDAALRRMDRTFNVDREVQRPGGITASGCVTTEEGCTLDPVIVDACVGGGTYPDCDTAYDEDYDACYDFGDCGGSGDWEWSGGGGGGEGASEEECWDCTPPEAEDSDICPQPLSGKTLPYLVNIAGRNHEFKFTGTMYRIDAGRSPSTYNISGPHASKDNWWMAESGTIRLVCWGRWITRALWLGTAVVQDDDLHFVMAPGHPDFETQPPYPPAM
jgi:hypothetical protein